MPNATASPVRGAVKLNGALINGWTAFEVDNNSYSSADSFSCTFSANALPADRNTAWFSNQQDMYVELFAGVPSNVRMWTADELPRWIYGQVDKIDYDPVAGSIEVTGRDLTRVFIDAKTTEKWQNKTASQIATILAKRHGMTASVTATKTLVGKYYEIDHEQMHDARTEWDLLTHLARIEQFVVYVRGQTLFFLPKPDPSKSAPYRVAWTPPSPSTGFPTCNVEGLKLSRTLTVSRGVVVVVRSWNDSAQKSFTATYPPSKASTIRPGEAAIGSGSQTYYYNVANLTQEKVVQFAQAKYNEIIQHEMLCGFDIPAVGADALDVTSVIELSGTGTAWDQMYFPDSLRRSLSITDGYRLSVSAKNHAPDSQEETQ